MPIFLETTCRSVLTCKRPEKSQELNTWTEKIKIVWNTSLFVLFHLHLAIFVGLSKVHTNCVVSENSYYKASGILCILKSLLVFLDFRVRFFIIKIPHLIQFGRTGFIASKNRYIFCSSIVVMSSCVHRHAIWNFVRTFLKANMYSPPCRNV